MNGKNQQIGTASQWTRRKNQEILQGLSCHLPATALGSLRSHDLLLPLSCIWLAAVVAVGLAGLGLFSFHRWIRAGSSSKSFSSEVGLMQENREIGGWVFIALKVFIGCECYGFQLWRCIGWKPCLFSNCELPDDRLKSGGIVFVVFGVIQRCQNLRTTLTIKVTQFYVTVTTIQIHNNSIQSGQSSVIHYCIYFSLSAPLKAFVAFNLPIPRRTRCGSPVNATKGTMATKKTTSPHHCCLTKSQQRV